MANWGQEVRRVVPSPWAKVGKTLMGSRLLPVPLPSGPWWWWWRVRGEEDPETAATLETDVPPLLLPPLDDGPAAVIDRDGTSFKEPVLGLNRLWCCSDGPVLRDLERSWRSKWWWWGLRCNAGDRLPGCGGRGGDSGSGFCCGCGCTTFKGGGPEALLVEVPSSLVVLFSRLPNLRGEMLRLATPDVTYCCNVLKKLMAALCGCGIGTGPLMVHLTHLSSFLAAPLRVRMRASPSECGLRRSSRTNITHVQGLPLSSVRARVRRHGTEKRTSAWVDNLCPPLPWFVI